MKGIITIGLPASGKSTWARKMAKTHDGVSIIERDAIRKSLLSPFSWEKWDKNREAEVDKQWEGALRNTKSNMVIVADTHLSVATAMRTISILKEIGCNQVEAIVFDLDPEVCIQRNAMRGTLSVPESAMKMLVERSQTDLPKIVSSLQEKDVSVSWHKATICGSCQHFRKAAGDTSYGYCHKNTGDSIAAMIERSRLLLATQECRHMD